MSQASKIRRELNEIGKRRQELDKARSALEVDTYVALLRADGIVTRSEASKRVGLNRSTTYELYYSGKLVDLPPIQR